jgi:multidrug efflux pump subunit AcrB
VARELRTELSKIDNVGLTYLVGDTDEIIRIAPDPKRLALNGVTLQQLAGKVSERQPRLSRGPGDDQRQGGRSDGRRNALCAGRDRQFADHQP